MHLNTVPHASQVKADIFTVMNFEETGVKNVILAAVSAVAISAGSAVAQDQQAHEFSDFNAIDVSGGFSAEVISGETYSVRFEGNAKDFERMEIEQRGDELKIDHRRRWFTRRNSLDVTVYITAPSPDALDASRGVSLSVSGLEARYLNVDASTGAEVDVSGSCSEMALDASTGAEIDARDLVCESVDADLSTGAVGRVHASQSVDADASTGATLRVSGAPRHTDVHSSMGGSVRIDRNS
jgi:opacity protein-like surface antigen